MKNNKISAKDRSFEKEKVQYRRTIREMREDLKRKDKELSSLRSIILEKEDELRQKQDWIDRLLEYVTCETSLSQEEITEFIKNKEFFKGALKIMTSYSYPLKSILQNLHSIKLILEESDNAIFRK